jgi:hypothetical protein
MTWQDFSKGAFIAIAIATVQHDSAHTTDGLKATACSTFCVTFRLSSFTVWRDAMLDAPVLQPLSS